MRSSIILLHGIAQQGHTGGSYRASVNKSATIGMRRSGHVGLAQRELAGDVELRPVFYADLFTRWQSQGTDLVVAEAADAEQREIEQELALALLEVLALRATDRADREAAKAALVSAGRMSVDEGEAQTTRLRRHTADAVMGLLSTRWAGGGRLTRAVSDHVPRLSWLPLREVSDYLLHHREEIQQRLVDALAPGDVSVVIAHSLGSVVAWETLARIEASVPLLITVGSPLGMPGVIYDRLVPTAPRWPGNVRTWVNLNAPNDMVATPQKIAQLFPSPIGRPLLDDTVDIGGLTPLGPHGFNRYLETPELWHPVATLV